MRRGTTPLPRHFSRDSGEIPERPPFREFALKVLSTEKRPFVWLPMYDDILDLYESSNRAAVVAPYRTGKSFVTRAYRIWKHAWPYPDALNERTVIVSNTPNLSARGVSWTRNQITSNRNLRDMCWWLHPVADPNIVENWKGSEFTVDRPDVTLDTPSWASTSIHSTYTGAGQSCVLFDDIHSFRNTLSALMIERTVETAMMEKMTRLDPDGQAIGISTAWGEHDFQFEMAVKGWPILVFTVDPEMADTPVLVEGQDLGVRRILIEGHPNWPPERIEQERREKGSRMSRLQLGSDPTATASENPIFDEEAIAAAETPGLLHTTVVTFREGEHLRAAVDRVPKGAAVRSLGVDPAGGGRSKNGFAVFDGVGPEIRWVTGTEIADLSTQDAAAVVCELFVVLELDAVRIETNFSPALVDYLKDPSFTVRFGLDANQARNLARITQGVHIGPDKETNIAQLALVVEHARYRYPPDTMARRGATQMRQYRAGAHPGDLLSAMVQARFGLTSAISGGGSLGGPVAPSRSRPPGRTRG